MASTVSAPDAAPASHLRPPSTSDLEASDTSNASNALVRSRRWRYRLRFAALAVLATAFAFFCSLAWVLPHLLTQTAPRWLHETSGRDLKVASASFNPFTLHLKASEISLSDGTHALARVAALDLKGSWASVAHFAWTAEHLTITRPEVQARIKADGAMDWSLFLETFPKSKQAPSNTVPRVVLHNVSIEKAAFRLRDERAGSAEQRLALEPISFRLNRLSTLPRDRGEYALEATLDDKTRVQWKGRVGLNPVESSGDVVLSNLPLARIPAIANLKLPVALDGTASIRANYSVAAGTDFMAVGVGGGAIEFANVRAVPLSGGANATGKADAKEAGGDDGTGDRAGVRAIKLSPISASWAKTVVNGTASHVFAMLPVDALLQDVVVNAAAQPDALLTISQIATAKPITIDVAARRLEVPAITFSGMQSSALRGRDGAIVLPFASIRAAAQSAPPASEARVASAVQNAKSTKSAKDGHGAQPSQHGAAPSSATPGAPSSAGWQVLLTELSADKAVLTWNDRSFAVPQTATAKLDFTLGATIATGDKTRITLSGKRAVLSDIALRDSDATTSPWFSARAFRLAPFAINALGANLELPTLEIVGPSLALGFDGANLDIAKKFAPAEVASTSRAATAAGGEAGGTVALSLAGVNLTDGRVSFTDNTLPTPLTQVVDAIGITVSGINPTGNRAVSASIKGTVNSGGTAQATVKFDPRGKNVDAEIALERIALDVFSPYLNRNTRLKLSKGEAAINGRVQAALGTTDGKTEGLRFDGKMAVREFEVLDETTNAPFVQWAELSSQNIRLTSGGAGLNLTLVDLLLNQPRGKFLIAEDGTLNLSQVGKATAAKAGAATPPPAGPSGPTTAAAPPATDAAPAPLVKVRRLQVTGGDVEFADLSLRPQFGTRISDLSGLIVGLATEPGSRAEVSLEGKVDQFGLARIFGSVAPMGATEFTDIKAIFRNLEMKSLSPYSGKFAGRSIESGKLSLDLEYKIQQRKLKGENQIVIDNLVLGERVDSKDASNLPLDLAIALLRDSDGVIDLGLPVQGSLDDPQYSYGSLIWKAIGNALTKIATAPFRALGALLGGGGDAFEAVIFEPGEARLLPPEREKLQKLAAALEKRPQLQLTIEGRFDKTLDREALAENILKLDVSNRAGMKPPGANEPLVISFTDTKVQAALDELAVAIGDEAVKLRALHFPPASNAVSGLLQGARERLSPSARAERAAARAKYYPELFKLLQSKQLVPEIAYTTLAGFRAEVIKNTLTSVNTMSTGRVSVAAPQPAKASKPGQVATTLALSAK